MKRAVKMEFREAHANDLKGLLELYAQMNPEDESLSPEKASEIWEAIESNPGFKYFVAVEGDKTVSTCNIAIIPNLTRGGRPFGMIENVVTDVAYRRLGIGKKVIAMAVEYAKKQGCYKIILSSSIKRRDAHLFYEKIGFDGNSKRSFEIRLI